MKKVVKNKGAQYARKAVSKARQPKNITKRELKRFVKQDKTNNAIARYYRVSESTIKRRIKRYGLTGLRKPGRKPFVKRLRVPKPREKWMPVSEYIAELNKGYHFVNIKSPNFKFVNPKTLVCSNEKRNPKDKFTTVGVYFIVLESDVYFIYNTRIKYRGEPVDFDEIYAWIRENALDMIMTMHLGAAFSVDRIIAFTFLSLPSEKPKQLFLDSKLK